MEKRSLGRTGMEVTVLGFGGAEIGYENATPETVERLLSSALDAGLNVIDTAECYADSEELIGDAVGHRRKDYFLFTKCGHAYGFEEEDWDLQMLEKSIDRSLKRLKTDCVDLLQLHTCSEELLRRGEVIEVVKRAKDAGKSRFIGYSGDNEAALFAVQCGEFDTLQTSVSVADQSAIETTLPEAERRGVGVIAKRPIANATFVYDKEPHENAYILPYWKRMQELDIPLLKGDGEQAISTALRFTLAQPAVCTAIVGTKNPDRWKSNARLLEAGPLPAEQVEQIRSRWKELARPDWVGQG